MNETKHPDRTIRPDGVSLALFAAGGLAMAFALLADVITGGSPGFGVRQWALAGAGSALVLGGAYRTPAAWARVRAAVTVAEGDRLLSLAGVLLLAVSFAAGSALAEGAVLLARAAFGEMLRLGEHVAWMAAIANTIVLTVVGLLLRGAGRVWPKARSPFVVVFVFALLAADAIVHRVPLAERAQPWSLWLLAAGAAAATARIVGRRLGEAVSRPERWAAASSAVVVLLALTALASTPVRERLARVGLPAASSNAPNILLIILDTVRAANLSLYGYERPTTPELERFAESGVVFDFAVAPASWTLPSHASLFTGRYANELSADWEEPLDGTHATLAEVLAGHGYLTAAFSANGAYVNANTGLERGFARFEDYPATAGEALRTSMMLRRALRLIRQGRLLQDGMTGRKSAADISAAFLGWLEDQPTERPFFAFLNYFDAHDPFAPAPPFDTLYPPVRPLPRLNWGNPPAPELVAAWRDQYDRAITYLDHELGLLFRALERRGVLDETIVVVTSDHGEHLGEHGFMRHGTTLYLPVLHVPLIVRYPARVPGGSRIAEPVTLRDVPATILDLAGIRSSPIPGESLAAVWERGAPPASVLYSEVREAVRIPARYPNAAADMHSIIADDLHYIRVTDGREELYRFRQDPAELHDLVSRGVARMELERLRKLMDGHLGTTSDPLAASGGPALR